MKSLKTVLIGHVCIDHNTTENASYSNWGSSVLYMANYIQQAYDEKPIVLTSYGPDILEYLPRVTLLPAKPDQEQTLIYENNTRSVPRIWRARNITSSPPPTLTTTNIAAIADADIIIIATLLPNYSPMYITEVLSHAKPESLKVLCPQGYFRTVTDDSTVVPRAFDEALQIVPQFNLVVYSEEDHPDAFKLARQWQDKCQSTTIIVTQGAKGASIVEKNTIVNIPTMPLPLEQIVDSVGCGDTFSVTVAHEFYKTGQLTNAVRTAHKAAARKLRNIPIR